MRKVSEPFKRKNRKGWWIRWFENGKKKHKGGMTKQEALLFRATLYRQLNRDVYDTISISLDKARETFKAHLEASNLATTSIKEYDYLFSALSDICPEVTETCQINSACVKRFISKRLENKSSYTVKKNLTQLKAFCGWLQAEKYEVGVITWPAVRAKEAVRTKVILKPESVPVILSRCNNKTERLAFLVSLCTGLRASDIDSITPACIADSTASGVAQKTGKPFSAPLPSKLVTMLDGFNTLKVGRKRWEAILDGFCTRHDLRRTFAQWIAEADNTNIASELLQHSDARVTKEYYAFAVKKVLIDRVFTPILEKLSAIADK